MKAYFKYFWWLFAIVLVLAAAYAGVYFIHNVVDGGAERGNTQAPVQRVYDFADKLTDEEEGRLEALIAKREAQIRCDLVIVTLNEPILSYGGYEDGDNTNANWNTCMRDYADDFYDDNNFGYDKVHGDGALLLDNWYQAGTADSQAGTWFSTCGRVYEHYTSAMVNRVLDDVADNVDSSPYRAYRTYVENVYREMFGQTGIDIPWFIVILIPVASAGYFIALHIKQKEGKKTTGASTYVEKNSVVSHGQKDELVNTAVTSRRIQTSSGGSGHSGGGRSGGHVSRGGVHHGGGGRRR